MNALEGGPIEQEEQPVSTAQLLRDTPDQAVEDAIRAVEEASASSESTSQIDLVQDDGSILSVKSTNGSDAQLYVFGADVYPEGHTPIIPTEAD